VSKITYAQRQRMRDTSFALPRDRKYPILDISHAKSALARVSAHGTKAEQEKVRRAVYRRFPSLKH
jgi:hypothetical protein